MEIDPCSLLRNIGLNEKTVLDVFRLSEVRGFQEGEAIYFGNSTFNCAPFFVLSGLVSARFKDGDQKKNTLNFYGPKTLLGEAVFFEDPIETEFRCETVVRVFALPVKEMVAALAKERMFANHLTKLSYWRYKHGECNRSVNKTKDAHMRVTFLLSHFVGALIIGHCYEDAQTNNADHKELEIPIKQSALANHFDVSRTVLSQSLQKLESKGWLQLGYGWIRFKRLPVWTSMYSTLNKNELSSLEAFEKIDLNSRHLECGLV